MQNDKYDNIDLLNSDVLPGNLRSEALNEMISRKSGFLEKWALLIFTIILLSLIAVSWFIKYRDVVLLRGTIIYSSSSENIIVPNRGSFTTGSISNGQKPKETQSHRSKVDAENTSYSVLMKLSNINLGKVQVGQSVQLRFDAYPYREFGHVDGKLISIIKVETNGEYLARAELPAGLVTNKFKTLRYHNGLEAEVRILSTENRLLERFYQNIRGAIRTK